MALNGTSIHVAITGATEAPTVTVNDIVASASLFANVTGASASRVMLGSNVSSTTSLNRSATQTLRVNGETLRADVAELTPALGDIVRNTNAASALAGVVTWDITGSLWQPVCGHTARQVVTLVAGTATVADVKITNTSRIRLFMRAPGGTVGVPFVSARTAGTGYVITSTSATDTSQLFAEVVTY